MVEESPKRHNSMDQIIGLLNEMGKSNNRQRSLSDGDHDGKLFYKFII